jgi:L-asparaginase II
MNEPSPVLAEVIRGPIVESRHRGVIVAVDADGQIIAKLGDDRLITSTRSTIKPIQAIPVITTGAADRFAITPKELAVICASHNGEQIHTDTVSEILHRLGLEESALLCGSHQPYSEQSARLLELNGLQATQLHNNCSGKHAGMLAVAVHLGSSTRDYVALEHPVQQSIIKVLSQLTDFREEIPAAIDGCSAPTFGVPLNSLAVAFARLAAYGVYEPFDETTSAALRRIVEAMTSFPEMVGGTSGRFDTELLRVAGGKLICKVGAEAVYSVGVLPCPRYPRGLGIAVKVEDGAYRGMTPAVLETLRQLGVLEETEISQLVAYHKPSIDNRRGVRVGQVRAVFQLEDI